jgi:thiamine biosynthesis lipoprotein
VLDPATGQSAASCWRTVSVAAATCVAANAASTAAIVLDLRAPAWLEARRLPARLIAHDGAVTTTSGWPVEAGAGAIR